MKVNLILLALVVLSALAVVYSKHESRDLFVELSQLERQRDELNVEWRRLQLEEGTLAGHGRLEHFGRERLHMAMPGIEDVMVVEQ